MPGRAAQEEPLGLRASSKEGVGALFLDVNCYIDLLSRPLRKKKKTVVKTTKWRQYFYGNVPVRWDEVTWLGKRPEPPEPLVPPVWPLGGT